MNTDVFTIRMSKEDKAFLSDMAKKTKDSMAGVMVSIFSYGKDAFYDHYLYKVAERKHLLEFFHLTEDDVKDKDFGLSEYQLLVNKMQTGPELAAFYNKVLAEYERLKKEWELEKEQEDKKND